MTIAITHIMHMSECATTAIDWQATATDVENQRRRALKIARMLGATVTEDITVNRYGVITEIEFTIRVP